MKAKPNLFHRVSATLCAAITLTLASHSAAAANAYFDTNGATTGSGNSNGAWDAVTANWSSNSGGTVATATWAAGNTAVFAAGTDFTGTRTVTASGTQSLVGIIVESEVSNLTLTGGTLDFGATTGSINTSAWGTTTGKTFNLNSVITGTNGLTIASNGDMSATGGGNSSVTKLGATNTFTGNVSITSGLVAYASDASFGDAANAIILNGGGLLDNNTNIALARSIQVQAGGGTFRAYGSTNVTWTSAISGAGAINRTDGGTINLAGDLSGYTGTYNNLGGNTTFSGANATATGSNLTIAAGTVNLNYATNDTDKLSNSTALTLGGGTVNLVGGTHLEVVGSTTLTALTRSNITRTSGAAVLNLGAITRGAGSALNLGTTDIASTTNGTASAVLTDATTGGAYATVGGTDWAAKDASNDKIVGLSTISGYTAFAAAGNVTLSGHADLTDATTVNPTYTVQAGSTPLTLRAITTPAATTTATTVALNGQTLSLAGYLSNQTVTISGAGALRAATAGGELVLNQTTGTTNISAVIADNTSASSVTKTGGGTLAINNSAQTYTGITYVNQGTFQLGSAISSAASSLATSGIVVASGATFNLGAGTLTAGQSITGTGNFQKGGNFITGGTINGTGNTYTGSTSVSVGNLTVGAGAVINGTSSVTISSINGATLSNNGSITTAAGNVTINGGNSTSAGLFTNGNAGGTTPGTLNAASMSLGAASGQTSGTAHGGAFTNNLNSIVNLTGGLTVNGEGSATAAITSSAAGSLFTNAGGTVTIGGSLTLNPSATTDTVSNKGGTYTQTGGTTTVTGGLSLVTGNTLITPGLAGNDAAFNISGGTASFSGNAGLNGTTTVSGTGTLNIAGTFYIGEGNTNRSGTFNQTGGTTNLTTATTDSIRIAHWGSETSTINLSGGTFNATAADMTLGWTGNGIFNLSGGTANLRGIDFSQSAQAGNATLTLTGGTLNIGTGGLYSSGGTGVKTLNLGAGTVGAIGSNWSSSLAMNLTDAGTGTTFNTADAVTPATARTIGLSGILSGATGKLIATGNGTLTLSGNNSYGGGTTVNSGTLAAGHNSAFGSGAITVNGGTLTTGAFTVANNVNITAAAAINGNYGGTVDTGTAAARAINTTGGMNVSTLTGQGTFAGGLVTVNSQHNPGNSPGSQTFNSGLAYGASTVVTMEVQDLLALAAGSYDTISVSGGLNIAAGAILKLAQYQAFDYTAAFWDTNHTITLINANSTTGTFGFDVTGMGGTGEGAWALIKNGNNFDATWTAAVPEPGAALLGGLGVLGLLRRRRA